MKIRLNDTKVGTQFVTTCAKVKRRYCGTETNEYIYDSFGVDINHIWMWARKPEQVINVKCTIIEEDVLVNKLLKSKEYDDNCVDYFGWITFEEDGTLSIAMISKHQTIFCMFSLWCRCW